VLLLHLWESPRPQWSTREVTKHHQNISARERDQHKCTHTHTHTHTYGSLGGWLVATPSLACCHTNEFWVAYILTNRIISKVRKKKKKKQPQNLEFGHSRWGETQKTINFGAKDRKSINFGDKLSFILSFL
jgi:hypothetical protein